MIIFLIILGVILGFLGVIIIRTLGFKPKENANQKTKICIEGLINAQAQPNAAPL